MATAIITDTLVQDEVRCISKSYQRIHGISGHLSDYLQMRSRLDAEYRMKAMEMIAAPLAAADIRRAHLLTATDLRVGYGLILGAGADAADLRTRFDALRKVSNNSRSEPFSYEPIRFCADERLDPTLPMLLAFDALVLEKIQGTAPEHGAAIYGPALTMRTVSIQHQLNRLKPVLVMLREQLNNGSEPPLFLNRHCDHCEFKQVCRSAAITTDNLTLLRGMTPKEVGRHNDKGIFTVRQLSYTFRSRRPARRQKQQFLHSHALQALAIRENKVHVHGDPKLSLPAVQVYLDIEGLPHRDFCYLIGVLVVSGDSCEHYAFWADDQSQQESIFVQLADLLAARTEYSLFHFGDYELKALRRVAPRLSEPHQNVLTGILSRSVNVLSLVRRHIYFPTYSNGLKDIAPCLGFKWTDPAASGLQSIVWREQWKREQSRTLKEQLIRYNKEDCIALRRVTEFIASLGAEPKAESLGGDSIAAAVVRTADIRPAAIRSHRFGRAEFSLPELQFVNKCAYFDYQRDKISVRGDASGGRKRKGKTAKRSRKVRINKRIELDADRCVHCGSRKISQKEPSKATIIDLKFVRGGVKRWVVRYSSWWYRCNKCSEMFRPPDYPKSRERYGNGIKNWVLYQNLIGGQSVLRIAKSCRDLFDLEVGQAICHRFKHGLANRFRPTAEAIRDELMRGPSLHVDETEVKLGMEKGYVWVAAGARGAYYEYRESRNGDFLAERMAGFSGVLVTDFFTAYDSLDCLQQKCLIHLIRDMNEDMRSHPFDEELKGVVQRFATILRSIIESVDKYGLSKRHLQKHKKPAMKFIEAVQVERLSTEVAVKYQKRMVKYGHRLFTFLDHDNVPWNNNNAEHAIHSFARYRRFADGLFTRKSLGEFLILLSVTQSCEYRDRNVLQFLLSGADHLD